MSEKNPFATEPVQPKKTGKSKTTDKTKTKQADQPVSPFGEAPKSNETSSVFTDYGSSAKQGAKKSHKKLIIGILSGVGAVIVIAVAVVVYIAITSVSKKDYQTAYEKLSDIQHESNSTDLSYTGFGYDTTAKDVDKFRDKANQAMQKTKDELNDLANLKAIKYDTEVKDRYNKLNQAMDKTAKSLDDSMQAVKTIVPVLEASSAVSDVNYSSDSKSYYGSLAKAYQAVADAAKKAKSSDGDMQSNLSDLADGASAMASYYQAEADDKDPGYSDYRKAYSKYSKSASNVSDSMKDLTKDLSNNGQDMASAANNLSRYLFNKSYSLSK